MSHRPPPPRAAHTSPFNPTASFSGHIARRNSDPLTAALQPPPNETPEQRDARLRREDDAKKRSEDIDRMLRREDKHRRKKAVKVLLLGQSESGKSTTLKQFQLLHTPTAFHKERIAWRFVIYLNLIRSIRRILEVIAPEENDAAEEEEESNERASIIITGSGPAPPPDPQPNYEYYRQRLAPLMDLEQRLMVVLADSEDNDEREATHLPATTSLPSAARTRATTPTLPSRPRIGTFTSFSSASSPHLPGRPPPISIPSSSIQLSSLPSASAYTSGTTSPRSPTSPGTSPASGSELALRPGNRWKGRLALGIFSNAKHANSGELEGWWEDPNDPVHLLNQSALVMTELWRDPTVRSALAEKRVRLEESSGFYLDEINRITAKMYFPTDDDVLRARLKTTGVVEHRFSLSKSTEFRGVEWVIYDVGGSRNQRQAWAPYFDDVNAIIFLAPISVFDQTLAEDPSVNRLHDSFTLWKYVIENKLLAHVNIVLFLNKCDLLKKKLQSGVRLSRHMPSYEDRPNDYDSVSQYFRNRFGAMHQSLTPNKSRDLYIHLTSVTDTRKTHTIISNVRDIILTTNLKSSSLM
ncbi:G-alpha-domain-containing protein [Epithele typhae]|uniref:G-alpha-domain-containing protein n=1 Tax=Epithele typhae TaxID=378194 RepID=UPI0020078100|nr:G-alpha-domain-containing protein [Epithele typhae]KAH9923126.1 G-alpha-domain-containing protein [Epithele typhae]